MTELNPAPADPVKRRPVRYYEIPKCKWCGKKFVEKSRYHFTEKGLSKAAVTGECGHTMITEAIQHKSVYDEMVSSDGRKPFPFQIESAEFIEDADCQAIIAHEMGLGKTVIACLVLKRHLEQLATSLIVVKSALKAQWWAEIFRWTGMVAQVIQSSKELPHFDIFPIVIVSFDTLRLLRADVNGDEDDPLYQMEVAEAKARNRATKSRKPFWTDEICSKFKSVIIDETQMIKNTSASRTRALEKIINAMPIKRVIGLSGTPIKNNAREYYSILHFVRPEMFNSEARFVVQDCYQSSDGKIWGLRDPERFHEKTKDFILRFTREEVLPDLPKIFRQFRLAEMEGSVLDLYVKTVKEFMEYMDDAEAGNVKLDMSNLLGFLSRMRHITGIAKIDAAIDFTTDFLLSTDRKLTIFVHHKKVADLLAIGLDKWCKDGGWNPPLLLKGGMDSRDVYDLVQDFKKPENRILIASTLAAGEGLNLQFCSDCLIMERQWTPVPEEQAEARFPRPGSTADKVNATYLIMAGTIDDFLTELVEKKRQVKAQVLDGREEPWDQSTLIMELAQVLRIKGLKKWGFK